MPENIEATQTGASGDDSLESMFESQFAEDDAGDGHQELSSNRAAKKTAEEDHRVGLG